MDTNRNAGSNALLLIVAKSRWDSATERPKEAKDYQLADASVKERIRAWYLIEAERLYANFQKMTARMSVERL